MELHKTEYSDFQKMTQAELKETETALRLQLNMTRLDVYGIKGKKQPAKGLRRSLARVLTAKRHNETKVAKS
jgi:ribosomal protein L29